MPCSNEAKTRNPLKFVWVPQTTELISAASGPKFTISENMWGRYCCIFPVVDTCLIPMFYPTPESGARRIWHQLYDRRSRNRRQFSGAGFWRRFLERVSSALVAKPDKVVRRCPDGDFFASCTFKPRLHDTTGCQTGCTTGLTTGCMICIV